MGEKRTRDLRQFQCSTRLCELCFASKYEQARFRLPKSLSDLLNASGIWNCIMPTSSGRLLSYFG